MHICIRYQLMKKWPGGGILWADLKERKEKKNIN